MSMTEHSKQIILETKHPFQKLLKPISTLYLAPGFNSWSTDRLSRFRSPSLWVSVFSLEHFLDSTLKYATTTSFPVLFSYPVIQDQPM
jgi:hypothetical protein